MTIYYFCNKGSGAVSACVNGSDAANGLTPATAKQTLAALVTLWQAAQAGDQFLLAQGAWWDGAATGQMQNTNATAANPVIIGSYDATSVWVGGAGIKPVLENTANAAIINFNKGTVVHTAGYTVQDIELSGGGTNVLWGIFGMGDTDYVYLKNLTIRNIALGIQCNGGSTGASALSDGISSNWIIRDCNIHDCSTIGILTGSSHVLIEGCTFDKNGTTLFDHSIYLGGATTVLPAKTIASISGDGVIATLTTATPHGIAFGSHFTITVIGSTSSGSGSFNVTSVVATVISANVITYPATGTPTAGVVGTYSVVIDVPAVDAVVRNNVITNGNIGAHGTANNAHIVVHGSWRSLLIENNLIREDVVTASGTCNGIEISSGGYAAPENYEGFTGVVVRNNIVINCALGIGLDLTVHGLVENNYVYSTCQVGGTAGIRMRAKYNVAVDATDQQPDAITIRYNTVYLPLPKASDYGIGFMANAADALSGRNNNLYGNTVVLGSTATTATMAYNTANMQMAWFTTKDYNACYYTGAAVPKWENTSSLATIQASGTDTNSVMISTTSVTADQPFFVTPTTSPEITTASALKNSGSPSLKPYCDIRGLVRDQGTADKGAYEFGASSLIPNSPTFVH
jgi:hypothetical protein